MKHKGKWKLGQKSWWEKASKRRATLLRSTYLLERERRNNKIKVENRAQTGVTKVAMLKSFREYVWIINQ